MARMAKAFLVSFLKVVNSIVGMVGIAMILYGFWMVRVWQRDMDGSSIDEYESISPWFVYTMLGVGITFCFVACLGHISADSSNGFCLACYAVVIFVLLLLETSVAADIFLNSNWEKDLPEDPTGRFHDFEEFVESNFEVFKWIGLIVFLSQGCCALLAMTIKATEQDSAGFSDENDEEYRPERLPLVNHPDYLHPPSYIAVDPPKLIHGMYKSEETIP